MSENNIQDTSVVQEGPEEVKGGFFASLVDIYLDPSKVFKRIAAGLQWWKAFIVLAVLNMLIAWLNIPVQRFVFSLNERGLSDEQLQAQMEISEKFGWVGIILAPVFILIVLFILAGLVNLTVNLVSAQSNYKKTMSLMCFAGLIGVLEQIITVIIVRVRGIETIETASDAIVSLGPAALFPEAEGFLAAAYQALSVFQIWYFIVFLFGISVIFNIDKKKAAVPAVVLWAIGLVFLYIGRVFGNLS